MSSILLKLWLLGGVLFCLSPKAAAQLPDTTKGSYRYFEIDELGNTYGISNKAGRDILLKIPTTAAVTYRYSNEMLGNIYSMDISNPFFLLVFYKEYQQLVFLDRTLSKTGNLAFGAIDLWDINAVCASKSGDIWIWDEGDFKLKKINTQGQLIIESRDLRLTVDPSIHLNKLQAFGDQLYGMDNDKGIFVFDTHAQLKYSLPLDQLEDFFVYQHKIFYVLKGKAYYHKIGESTPKNIYSTTNDIQQIRANSHGIFILRKGQIELLKDE